MPTHSHFADWYRSAALTPPEGLLDKRWAGVEEVAQRADASMILSLAKLFALPNARESNVPEGLREAFHTYDDAFQYRDNLQELRVLAGAILHLIIERDGALSPAAALALVCGSFGPREVALIERRHVDFAQRFLVRLSVATRRCGKPGPIEIPSFKKERFAELIPQVAPNQVGMFRDALVNALPEVASRFCATLEQAAEAISELTHTANVREEELAILWWLEAQFSRDLRKPFSEVGYLAGSIVLPCELADLTKYVPGPEAAIAVLVRALQLAGAPSSSEAVTIANATNAAPRAWRESLCEGLKLDSCELLTPILLAVHKSLETDGPDEWLPVYRKGCDIPPDRPFPLVQFSIQLFRERMLVRATREVKR